MAHLPVGLTHLDSLRACTSSGALFGLKEWSRWCEVICQAMDYSRTAHRHASFGRISTISRARTSNERWTVLDHRWFHLHSTGQRATRFARSTTTPFRIERFVCTKIHCLFNVTLPPLLEPSFPCRFRSTVLLFHSLIASSVGSQFCCFGPVRSLPFDNTHRRLRQHRSAMHRWSWTRQTSSSFCPMWRQAQFPTGLDYCASQRRTEKISES